MLDRLLVVPVLLLMASFAGAADKPRLPPAAKRPVDFAKDIKPILDRSCITCHGPGKQSASLRLDDGTHALKGGDSGTAIQPGESEKSLLIRLIAGLDAERPMPPGERKKLTAEEVGLIRAWIDQGATWPKGDAISTIKRSTHWAFQPIRRPPMPVVTDRAWPRNPLDTFVLSRLEKQHIAPSPEADPLTLMRRAYLDLIGLPPSPDETDAYLADTSPGAYERLIDRLLSSPAYGERWGRHWLDAARYADSDGFEKDTGRPFAWRFRHWVIEALNANMGYDRFTIEQLAGDLLVGSTIEQKVATGFHRNTLTNREGGVDAEQYRVEAMVDRVNTTARVWLGLTLGCAQCHDHKYDPLSQREYYRFFAFFNNDVDADIAAPLPGYNAEGLSPAQQKKLTTLVNREKQYRAKQLPAKQAEWEQALTAEQQKALPAAVAAIVELEPSKRNAKQAKALTDYFAKQDAELVSLTKQIADLRKQTPGPVQAQTLALGKPRATHVMIRGDFLRPGVVVKPGVPDVLASLKATNEPTRLELAKWLVADDNPLTARVTVNSVWQKYFGRGLVASTDDFGTQGEKPTHPELLDWLADEFMHRGWSLKELHRLIVSSATYRQSSAVREELSRRDPYLTRCLHVRSGNVWKRR